MGIVQYLMGPTYVYYKYTQPITRKTITHSNFLLQDFQLFQRLNLMKSQVNYIIRMKKTIENAKQKVKSGEKKNAKFLTKITNKIQYSSYENETLEYVNQN